MRRMMTSALALCALAGTAATGRLARAATCSQVVVGTWGGDCLSGGKLWVRRFDPAGNDLTPRQ